MNRLSGFFFVAVVFFLILCHPKWFKSTNNSVKLIWSHFIKYSNLLLLVIQLIQVCSNNMMFVCLRENYHLSSCHNSSNWKVDHIDIWIENLCCCWKIFWHRLTVLTRFYPIFFCLWWFFFIIIFII